MEELPNGRFSTVVVDSPWSFATRSVKGKGRGAEAHYDTMSIDDIKALPVGQWAAADAAQFLWAIDTILDRTFEVIRAWGFTYKTVGSCWAKLNRTAAWPVNESDFFLGLGHWRRANCELCLLATRGSPRRRHADVRKLSLAPRREHSVKPDEIYPRIERLLARGAYLELFASAAAPHREGWTRWVGKDRAGAALALERLSQQHRVTRDRPMTRPTEAVRHAAAAVGFGGTLPAEAQRGLRLVGFRPPRKGGLLGFATVEFLALGLVVANCQVQNTHGRIWCGLPSKPVLDQYGHHVRITSKGQHATLLKWRDRARSDRFSERVVELVRQQYPGALK